MKLILLLVSFLYLTHGFTWLGRGNGSVQRSMRFRDSVKDSNGGKDIGTKIDDDLGKGSSDSTPMLQPPPKNSAEEWNIDVSDLGITIEDLDQPIKEIFAESGGSSQRGYYAWRESTDKMSVRWRHPGTSGQPHSAVRVDFTETTIAVFIFNYNVWTGMSKGCLDPSKCSYTTEEPPQDGLPIPVVTMNIVKAEGSRERWNEVLVEGIDGVAPNSMLQ